MQTEFEILNSKTNWNVSGKPAMIRISKHGVMRFTVEAVRLLKLKLDMRLTFLLHPNDNGIIYFHTHADGLPLKADAVSKNGVALYCCGRKHAARMLEFFKISTANKTFDITAEQSTVNGQQCWFILKDKIHKPIKWRKQ